MKKTRSRKKVKENQSQVLLIPKDTHQTPGQAPEGQAMVNVNATNPGQAVAQAIASMPGKKFDQVVVSTDPNKPPMPVADGSPAKPPKPTPTGQPPQALESVNLEGFRYPYGIVVPKQFEAILVKAVVSNNKTVPGIVLRESQGRISLTVETAAAMALLLSRLSKSKQKMAKTIVEGIKASQ